MSQIPLEVLLRVELELNKPGPKTMAYACVEADDLSLNIHEAAGVWFNGKFYHYRWPGRHGIHEGLWGEKLWSTKTEAVEDGYNRLLQKAEKFKNDNS